MASPPKESQMKKVKGFNGPSMYMPVGYKSISEKEHREYVQKAKYVNKKGVMLEVQVGGGSKPTGQKPWEKDPNFRKPISERKDVRYGYTFTTVRKEPKLAVKPVKPIKWENKKVAPSKPKDPKQTWTVEMTPPPQSADKVKDAAKAKVAHGHTTSSPTKKQPWSKNSDHCLSPSLRKTKKHMSPEVQKVLEGRLWEKVKPRKGLKSFPKGKNAFWEVTPPAKVAPPEKWTVEDGSKSDAPGPWKKNADFRKLSKDRKAKKYLSKKLKNVLHKPVKYAVKQKMGMKKRQKKSKKQVKMSSQEKAKMLKAFGLPKKFTEETALMKPSGKKVTAV